MEIYKNLKKGTKAGLILSLILIVLTVVAATVSFITGRSSEHSNSGVQFALNIAMCAAIAVYAVWGYKKPQALPTRQTRKQTKPKKKAFLFFAQMLGTKAYRF